MFHCDTKPCENAGRTAGLGALRKPNPRNISEPDTDMQVGGGRQVGILLHSDIHLEMMLSDIIIIFH